MPNIHAVVQHSAYGYKGDPQFRQGLESRQLKLKGEQSRVEKVGGKLFDDYMEAEDYCMKEMYPEGVEGLTPQAPGSFSRSKVDGLAIYIPAQELESFNFIEEVSDV